MVLAVGNGREGVALVARELSLACHREHGTQTFAVDDIGLANLALLAAFPGNQPGDGMQHRNHLALALTI
jgi:hypothetical protein